MTSESPILTNELYQAICEVIREKESKYNKSMDRRAVRKSTVNALHRAFDFYRRLGK